MARERNQALWAQWRERVARYERSTETSAAFCRREGVSTASLFTWRRRLAAEAQTKARAPTFVPVRLTAEPYPLGLTGAGERVEIELPGGAVVRLTDPSERLLRGAIAAAAEASSREAPSC